MATLYRINRQCILLLLRTVTVKFRPSDWSNIAKVISRHYSETNESDHVCVGRGEAFERVQSEQVIKIIDQLNRQHTKKLQKSRNIITEILEILILMAISKTW